ncbi:MAG TPA: hypothetical protein VLL08_03820 [Kineosporiaceae bacterium]|nr:hypothetical protein [Kineosporiaceae bacterium]
MGFLKQFKDLKNVMAVAPELLGQAQQVQANAQSYGMAAQQAATSAPAIDPADPRLAPIAGVDLVTYARVIKSTVNGNLGAEAVGARAQSLGVTPEAWQQAGVGWPARMRDDIGLAVHYGTVYGQVMA